MAAAKSAVSFDDIIQADRQRRKNEALANEIFGRGRRASIPSNGNRKLGLGSSLASRVGIAKPSQRSVSSTPRVISNKNSSWGHDLHHVNNPQASRLSRRENPIVRLARNDRIHGAVASKPPHNGVSRQNNMSGTDEEISIRGLAGPYVVIGNNFAPGTTAADIESAMIPSGGEMQSCKIIAISPTVMAEMVFAEKANAENVIATFNNKKADGRILHIYLKQGDTSAGGPPPAHQAPIEPRAARVDLTRPESTRSDPIRLDPIQIDTVRPEPVRSDPTYDSQREQSDRNRRRADPEFQDGSFGFQPRDDQVDVDMDDRRDAWHAGREENEKARDSRLHSDRRLYSDNLYSRPRGRGFR